MKKLFQILLIISLLTISMFIPPKSALSSSLDAVGGPDIPSDPPHRTFLPVIRSAVTTYQVSGIVTGPGNTPLAGALVTDGTGKFAVTDQLGRYQIDLPVGSNALAPQKDGFYFTPSVIDIEVRSDMSNQDFSGVAGCDQGIVNGDFEGNDWWTFDGVSPADYTTDKYHSPSRSVVTGILNGGVNVEGYSWTTSSPITLSNTATSAKLRMWLFPTSGEAANSPVAATSGMGVLGGATNGNDAQYVLVLDEDGTLLDTLLWINSNAQMWTYFEFNLTKYVGQTIKLQIGTYNDGDGGVASLHVDDVSLNVCSDIYPATPLSPAVCGNFFVNSGFESNGGWGIPTTVFPAGYSYDYAYAGLRSMRTGIPIYSPVNKYSYSDAYQTVTIPNDATSAVLRMKILPRSQEPQLLTSVAGMEPEAVMPPPGTVWEDAVLAKDTVYIVVLNPNDHTILETLWSRSNWNSSEWKSKEFDLIKYRGKKIRIQFGTYNDGLGGKSSLYVDEAYFDICDGGTPPPPPPPPPPPTCTERIGNNSFETNLSWYIPATAFSAGYSTARAHTGLRSMRTGIIKNTHNRYSYSDFGQVVNIPAGSSSATLGMWIYTQSSEPVSMMLANQPAAAEMGSAVMAGDVQYLLILDYWGNWIDTLLWQRTNDGYWKNVAFNVKKYAGSTIRLQWGTYNDGWGGVTSMFVDDVSLIACP